MVLYPEVSLYLTQKVTQLEFDKQHAKLLSAQGLLIMIVS